MLPPRAAARPALAALACVGIACCLVVAIGSAMASSTVTTYAATCLTQVEDGHCSAAGRTLDAATFTVSIERQQVWVSESGMTRALTACRVESTQNWRCRSSDGRSELGIAAGRPWLIVPGGGSADIFFISKWRYLWMKSGEPQRSGLGQVLFK